MAFELSNSPNSPVSQVGEGKAQVFDMSVINNAFKEQAKEAQGLYKQQISEIARQRKEKEKEQDLNNKWYEQHQDAIHKTASNSYQGVPKIREDTQKLSKRFSSTDPDGKKFWQKVRSGDPDAVQEFDDLSQQIATDTAQAKTFTNDVDAGIKKALEGKTPSGKTPNLTDETKKKIEEWREGDNVLQPYTGGFETKVDIEDALAKEGKEIINGGEGTYYTYSKPQETYNQDGNKILTQTPIINKPAIKSEYYNIISTDPNSTIAQAYKQSPQYYDGDDLYKAQKAKQEFSGILADRTGSKLHIKSQALNETSQQRFQYEVGEKKAKNEGSYGEQSESTRTFGVTNPQGQPVKDENDKNAYAKTELTVKSVPILAAGKTESKDNPLITISSGNVVNPETGAIEKKINSVIGRATDVVDIPTDKSTGTLGWGNAKESDKVYRKYVQVTIPAKGSGKTLVPERTVYMPYDNVIKDVESQYKFKKGTQQTKTEEKVKASASDYGL